MLSIARHGVTVTDIVASEVMTATAQGVAIKSVSMESMGRITMTAQPMTGEVSCATVGSKSMEATASAMNAGKSMESAAASAAVKAGKAAASATMKATPATASTKKATPATASTVKAPAAAAATSAGDCRDVRNEAKRANRHARC